MQAAAFSGGTPPGTIESAAFVNVLDQHCDPS